MVSRVSKFGSGGTSTGCLIGCLAGEDGEAAAGVAATCGDPGDEAGGGVTGRPPPVGGVKVGGAAGALGLGAAGAGEGAGGTAGEAATSPDDDGADGS